MHVRLWYRNSLFVSPSLLLWPKIAYGAHRLSGLSGAMHRRNTRLRREYLYRKSLEGKERDEYERKRKIRQALDGALQRLPKVLPVISSRKALRDLLLSAEGKPLPTELRRDERELRRQVELEDDNTAVPRQHIDDEYARAEERDPKVLVTTSRDPSSRLTQFAKELKLVLPNAQRMNRGGKVLTVKSASSSTSLYRCVSLETKICCSLAGRIGFGRVMSKLRLHRHRRGPRAPWRAGRHGDLPPALRADRLLRPLQHRTS